MNIEKSKVKNNVIVKCKQEGHILILFKYLKSYDRSNWILKKKNLCYNTLWKLESSNFICECEKIIGEKINEDKFLLKKSEVKIVY